jgi:hypothetical protein
MYIDEARLLDLQPVLGAELLGKVDTNALGAYNNLINGCTYVYDLKTYTFKGLKKALAYFVFARLKRGNSSQVTAFGNVVKIDPNSEPETEKSIARVSNECYDVGVAYLQDCMDYVGRLFPLQEYLGSQSTQRKFRISEIGD